MTQGGDARGRKASSVRSKLFRATAGLSLYEQGHLAQALASTGNNVLETIQHMKARSHKQKSSSKASTTKFQWLHDQMHLKKLEQAATKDVDATILKLVNDSPPPTLPPASRRTPGTRGLADPEDASYEATMAAAVAEMQTQRLGQLRAYQSDRDTRAAMKLLLHNIRTEAAVKGPIWFAQVKVQLQSLMLDSILGHHALAEQLSTEADACNEELQTACRALCRHRPPTAATTLDGASFRKATGRLRTSLDTWRQLLANAFPQRDEDDAADPGDVVDPDLKYSILLEFETLDAQLRSDLAALDDAYRAGVKATGGEVPADGRGGAASHTRWTAEDHERFLKVFKDCDPKGVRNEAFLQRLAPLLPHKTKRELSLHDQWHRLHRRYLRDTLDRNKEHEAKVAAAFNKAKETLVDAAEACKARQNADADQARRAAAQALLHAQVARFQLKRDLQAEAAAHQEEIARLEAQALQDALETKRRREHELKKKLVQDYKGWQELHAIADEEAAAAARANEEELKAKRMAANAERVQFRVDELEHKAALQQQEALRQKEEVDARRKALEDLKLTTPYAAKLAEMQVDPERTRQPTVAFQANVDAAHEPLGVHEAGLFPSHGYDTDKLFKDARFKLGLALQNAGLAQTEYARQAMANVAVRNAGAYRHSVQPKTQLW
ncbi:hypothetical protein ACHHYP_02590 [Achlya hypogyna]|uniref:Uncharacterized protein n=1 Tax=Achlya hypogyna TaxID=1202772 RepID=A0A1V9ZRZ4_ACHHY|nr:hypothetical protein ACHHYP_02590 [Achlya hypogyna]